MNAETGAKAHEPEVASSIRRTILQCFLEREKHGRAAHVAVFPQHAGTRFERMRRDDRSDRQQDIATAGVCNNARNGA